MEIKSSYDDVKKDRKVKFNIKNRISILGKKKKIKNRIRSNSEDINQIHILKKKVDIRELKPSSLILQLLDTNKNFKRAYNRPPFMYRILHLTPQPCPLQVKSLNSSATFIYVNDNENTLYVWFGLKSSPNDQELAKSLSASIIENDWGMNTTHNSNDLTFKLIEEDHEKKHSLIQFVNFLSSDEGAYRSKRAVAMRRQHISNSPVQVCTVSLKPTSTSDRLKLFQTVTPLTYLEWRNQTEFWHQLEQKTRIKLPELKIKEGQVLRTDCPSLNSGEALVLKVGNQWWVRIPNITSETEIKEVESYLIQNPTINDPFDESMASLLDRQYSDDNLCNVYFVYEGDEGVLFREHFKHFTSIAQSISPRSIDQDKTNIHNELFINNLNLQEARARHIPFKYAIAKIGMNIRLSRSQSPSPQPSPIYSTNYQKSKVFTYKSGLSPQPSPSKQNQQLKESLVSSVSALDHIAVAGNNTSDPCKDAAKIDTPEPILKPVARSRITQPPSNSQSLRSSVSEFPGSYALPPSIHSVSNSRPVSVDWTPAGPSSSLLTPEARLALVIESKDNPGCIIGYQIEIDEGPLEGVHLVTKISRDIFLRPRFLLSSFEGETWAKLKRGSYTVGYTSGIMFRPLKQVFDPLFPY